MSDMKCPICNEPMKEQMGGTCISYQETNCICNIAAPKLIWKELERTRKALDKALHYLDAEYYAYIMVHKKEPELIAKVLAEIKHIIETKE